MHCLSLLAMFGLAMAAPAEPSKPAGILGFDISHHQSKVNFTAAFEDGLRFVYIKATEGLTYKDPKFWSHRDGAIDAGLLYGDYHFAHGESSARAQVKGGVTDIIPLKADYFMKHGSTTPNGGVFNVNSRRLPGMLVLDGACIDETWILEFSDRYHQFTSKFPVLYSTPAWWKKCTNNTRLFILTNPLMMAYWGDPQQPVEPQGAWATYHFWQYSNFNKHGGNSVVFNGDKYRLLNMTKCTEGLNPDCYSRPKEGFGYLEDSV
ncbi:hypothetical protein Q7P37_008959 [Cladosporium fusiforme]